MGLFLTRAGKDLVVSPCQLTCDPCVHAAGKMISQQLMSSRGICYFVVGVKFPLNVSKRWLLLLSKCCTVTPNLM